MNFHIIICPNIGIFDNNVSEWYIEFRISYDFAFMKRFIMSIQSDVELLSIMAMEKYAQLHGLTNEQVMTVFNNNHVIR